MGSGMMSTLFNTTPPTCTTAGDKRSIIHDDRRLDQDHSGLVVEALGEVDFITVTRGTVNTHRTSTTKGNYIVVDLMLNISKESTLETFVN